METVVILDFCALPNFYRVDLFLQNVRGMLEGEYPDPGISLDVYAGARKSALVVSVSH